MRDIAIDVSMIVNGSKNGTVTPLRFQISDEEGTIHTFDVAKIDSVTRHTMPGIDDYIYICESVQNGNQYRYKLRMRQESGRMSWMLLEQI